jgi:streptogramin lyase
MTCCLCAVFRASVSLRRHFHKALHHQLLPSGKSQRYRQTQRNGLLRFAHFFCLAMLLFGLFAATSYAQEPGQNVNMVSGTVWPYGDPFLERQDEPSLGVSTRNPLHLLAGANDYRTVDLNLPESDVGEGTAAPVTCPTPPCTGEPWVGLYMSIDGGARWQSTLLPGYPQDTSAQGISSPLHGFTTAADPVIAAGTNGMFYYGGIAFDRGSSLGTVFVARFMDLNNKENGNIAQNSFPIRYVNTVPIAYGTNSPNDFLDKPWIATDIPRGSATCSLSVTQSDGSVAKQTIPAGNVYLAYAVVATSSTGVQTSTIYFSRSTNCGSSWSSPIAISKGYPISQGATIQIDPETGIVYVAWRVIHNTPTANDGIAIAASLNGGQSFLPPLTLVSLPPYNANSPTAHAFFDQNTTETSFRTTAYPALAVGDSGIPLIPGPLYVAWSQRGEGPNGEARIMMLAIPGNISITSSGIELPTPFPIDNGPLTNDSGGDLLTTTGTTLTAGHQVMPMMTFNQGNLMVVYYDLRQDHTIGEFTPSVLDGMFVPDANGNFFEEARDVVTEEPTASYSPYFIDDAGLTVRRHTIDLVLAQATEPGYTVPTFNYVRVTHYDFGLFEGQTQGASAPFNQLKFDPPNLPMFELGEAAFMGDYIGITGQPYVLVQCGSSPCWTFNNPSPPGVAGTKLAAPKPAPNSAVNFASWTSNQDVIPPLNGEWDTYTAISSGPSVYKPSQTVPTCQSGNEGDRNQNVYMSRISQGLLVSSPQVSKPLSSTIERGFVILVQNATSGRSAEGFVNYFRLTVANQPTNGFASFAQFVPPSPVPAPPFPSTNNGIKFPLTSLDVAVAPHTGVARTVFAVSSNPTASILVNVQEISGLGGTVLSGGMSSFILLNADGTVPTGLVDPNGQTGSNSITDVELYNPNVSAPNVSAPNVSAPNVSAPNVSAPNVSAPNVSAPNVSAPNVSAPNVSAYGVANPNVSAPNVSAPNVSAAPPSDGSYTITNTGNTTSSYNVSVTGTAPGTPLQLLLSQIYMTPQTNGQCELITQQQDITLSNVPNVPLTPINSLPNPNVSAAPVTEPTISLGPGDSAVITLRGNVSIPEMQEILTQVAPVIQPQAVNSNSTTSTTPPVSAPLFITTASLPDAVVGRPYNASVQVIGGQPPYQNWLAGNLPGGLTTTVSTNTTTLTISGTPTASNLPGTPVTFQVSDSEQGASQQTATRILNLRIAGSLVVNPFTLSPGVLGLSYGSFNFTATGGIAPLTWQLQSGGLDGLVLNSNGTLSGTPTSAGSFSFVLLVTDSSSPNQAAVAQGTLVVGSNVTSLLSFVTQPSNTQVSQTITPPVQVEAVDSSSVPLPGVSITLSLTTGPGTLSGTLTQVTGATGIATFPNLTISAAGTADVLTATAGSVIATSSAFNITSPTPQACAPIPGAPVSWYPFNGNTLDIRGGRPGVLQGVYSFVPAEVGTGYKPGVEGSVVVAPNSSALPVFAFSIGSWIRVDGIDSVPLMQVLWKGDNLGTTTTTPYALAVEGTSTFASNNAHPTQVGTPGQGKVVVIIGNGDTELDLFSNATLSTGTFYYIAVTADENYVTLYINGSIDTQTAQPPTAISNYPLQIGGIQALNSDTFDGVINQLQIWPTAISQFQVSTIYQSGAAGECQAIWFTEVNSSPNKIGSIAPNGTNATEYSTPTANSFPYNIVAGPDGNVWFTEATPNNIGEFVSLGGGEGIGESPITYPPTDGTSSAYDAWGITSGPDGNLWFSEAHNPEDVSFVGNITTGGTINTFSTGLEHTPEGITPAPDGNLWFTEPGSNTIGNIQPTSTSTVNHYAIPTSNSDPVDITIGSDGNLWFTEGATNKIGVITTGGTVTQEYSIPPGLFSYTVAVAGTGYQTGDLVTVVQSGASGGTLVVGTVTASGGVQNFNSTASIGTNYTVANNVSTTGGHGTGLQINIINTASSFGPAGITLGPDGNVWFTAENQSNVLEVSPSGQFTAYPVPNQGGPLFITEGPDGNIWYTDNLNNAIAQLVPSTGVTTEFPTPTQSSGPWGIGTGPAVIPVPAAPTIVEGTNASNGEPLIIWSASPSSGVVGYNVYRGTSATGPFMLVNSGLVVGTSFADASATQSIVYYYFVTAVGAGNTESPASNQTSITGP